MVHKPDNGDSTQRDRLTHRIHHMESDDIPDGDVGYELARETNTLEIVRIPNRLVGISASGDNMTEFSKRFEQLLGDVSGTKIEVEKTKVKLDALDDRINGALAEICKHINEGTVWHRAIIGIIVMVVVQIISISYLFGTLAERVGRNR